MAEDKQNKSSSGAVGLVLGRRKDERILIGKDVVITLVDVRPGRARIGVRAPDGVRVRRAEVPDDDAGIDHEEIDHDRIVREVLESENAW